MNKWWLFRTLQSYNTHPIFDETFIKLNIIIHIIEICPFFSFDIVLNIIINYHFASTDQIIQFKIPETTQPIALKHNRKITHFFQYTKPNRISKNNRPSPNNPTDTRPLNEKAPTPTHPRTFPGIKRTFESTAIHAILESLLADLFEPSFRAISPRSISAAT